MAKLPSGLILLFLIFLTPSYSFAEDGSQDKPPIEFSGNITFTTDYHDRGITQTDEKPAGQAGIEGSYKNNFYVGIWSSNIDFAVDDQADFEVDYYGGYRKNFGPYSADLTIYYYSYPGAKDALDYDYFEFAFSLGKKFELFDLTGSVYYSPDNFGSSGDALYFEVALEVPLLESGFDLFSHFGRQYVDDNSRYGFPDYNDWSVGLAYKLWDFYLNLAYIDTNLSNEECADGCDARAVFAISRGF